MDTKPQCFGTLIRRYKRFLADVQLDNGDVVTVHCPNSGKLLGLTENPRVLLTDHGTGGTRKLRYTWEWFLDDSFDTAKPIWVGVNTHAANHLIEYFLITKQIPEFAHYPMIKREVKYGHNSRIDFLLTNGDQRLYLEIKSVHMRRGDHACFPDCPTERGAKHMRELANIIDDNTKAAVLYLVQRDDCTGFSYADDLDPIYAAEAKAAAEHGVSMYAYAIQLVLEKMPVLVRSLNFRNH